ncbi:MAG: ribokinase [Ilumatobacter sp.]|nr:ribokinase [Ilumatobacter sp.]
MIDVAVIGSLNLDLVARCDRHPDPGETVLGTTYAEHPGGKGLNQAVAAARAGATVALLGAVGDDEPGRRLRQTGATAGVDVSRVAVSAAPTGRALIVVDDRGENSIVVVPGANAELPDGRLPAARVVLAQLEVPLASVTAAFEAARATGATTVLNPAPAQPLSPTVLALCDIVVPNEHEVELLGGVAALHGAGVGTVITTRGAAGVVVSDGTTTELAAFAVDVVDTTGAGDAFCGNLAARLAAGDDLHDAIRWAMAAGALAVGVSGAVASLPTGAATQELMALQA